MVAAIIFCVDDTGIAPGKNCGLVIERRLRLPLASGDFAVMFK